MVGLSLVLSLVAAAAMVLAADAHSKKVVKSFVPGAYIFELEEGHDPAAFERSVGKDGTTRMKLDYELFKGVSVQLHDVDKAHEKAAKLAATPAVKAVYPVQLFNMPKPKVEWVAQDNTKAPSGLLSSRADESPDIFSPHVMTQVDKLRAKGITGKGVKIAVVDTGIDYKHPALGGCFGKGCLVAFGTDLVGDAYDGSNTPYPDSDPMDCGGHGSHVAGIVAAQPNSYGFSGTAPGATLGAYRVFGCKGQAGNDVLIAAFNQAYQDGANIITASIGGPSGWSEEPWAVAVSRIVDKGVPCTVSAGNEGAEGIFYASTAANGRHTSAIASFDNVQTPALLYSAKYQIDSDADVKFGYVPSEPADWDGVTLPAWSNSLDPTIPNDGCDPFPDNTPDLGKYIVLIRRGTCAFSQKVNNAVAKGAKYIVVYNNNPVGAIPMDLAAVPPRSIKAASMIDGKTGTNFINALKDGKKLTLKMVSPQKADTDVSSSNNTITGGALSTFTSWGPTWEMDAKPQFGAVGGNVLSTYPRALGSYAVLSGTSMSCPQTAGIIALIREVRGACDPALIQNLLSANAKPQLFNDGSKFYDFLAPVPQQGGGLIQAYDAAYATTILSPSSLSFNDTDHFVKKLKFKLENTGKEKVTYKITHAPAISMYALGKESSAVEPFPNQAIEAAAATIQFSETSITLHGGQSKSISVSPTPPQGLDAKRLALWSGYIAVNGTDGTSLSLPYQGLTGSLHKSPVLGANNTWISKSTDKQSNPQPPNSTFLIPAPGNAGSNDTLPQLTVSLYLGSRKIRADIVPLTTCPPKNLTTESHGIKTIGQPYNFPSLWGTRGLNNFPWDGRLDSGNYAPPGKYKFVVYALRIFGDEKKKEDWDVSTSAPLHIKYL
ncbi:subtilisin-like serine protease PR1C [Metarhizium album ARSEF 1941]|uniref:Subtilisin-like serine protease PR1C n=1 Tax=Metarhizium album (strain ARSEF 1941) TaxID=1081103 RepID=A0A0B2WUF1_METAS|nr:subtilisin-like serine protease PR1C [Metarhizium album ARSEF 1941]KHN97107.1 subtilisin-like serine protease PR1C [Metarhizium album ARSEF 1941]